MTPQDQQKLESLVSAAVRNLPPRRAPVSLESRIQEEIVRRSALPWWRKSFLNWPLPARAVFVVVSAAVVQLVFMAIRWFTAGFGVAQVKTAFAAELQWLRVGRALFETAIQSTQAVVGSVSPLWLYGGAVTIVALYVALFGLGAAAYRTLYASR